MPNPRLADRIRRKLDAAILPSGEPVKTRTGYGSGLLCVACDAVIFAAQVEVELEMPDGALLKMHWGCHGLWLAERTRRGLLPPSPASDSPERAPRLDAPPPKFDERVRGKLISGALPLESPEAMWGGHGTRRVCDVCETVIQEAEIEYELDMPGGGRLFMHMGCHSAWMTERIRLGFA